MNLSKLKEKYKQILEEPQPNSGQSDQQWELAYSRMKNKRRKHILTESQCMNRSSISTNSVFDQQKYLKVKEKLAQSIANLNKKDIEIQELKTDNIKAKEQIKILEEQIGHLKEQLTQYEQKVVQQKVAYNCIEKNLENIERCVQSQKMDKELLQRQIQYYQCHIETQKKQNQQKSSKMEELKKELKTIQKYKAVTNHLKEDIARLRQLLAQTEKYKVFASKIQYKNYLGKTCKQHQCWVSEDLVQDVEAFIRKQGSGTNINNKQFIANLTKFVSKNIEVTKSIVEKKAKKIYSSKVKDTQRRQNHSMNIMEVREQEMRRSNILGCSNVKTTHKNTLNDSKLFTQSLYGGLEKSNVNHSINKNRQVCLEILSSFRKGIMQLIQSKQIRKKKLIKLVDWIIEGVMSIFPKDKATVSGDFRLETEEIKITL